MADEYKHVPVLAGAVSTFLAPKPCGVYVDATVGGGGHALRIAGAVGRGGVLIGIDRDATAIEAARACLQDSGPRIILIHSNYSKLAAILDDLGFSGVDGVLFDLGLSSPQLDMEGRGFSYSRDEPLDMRMDRDQAMTARQLVNEAAPEELARIIRTYGEERWSDRIAHFIAGQRSLSPIETTGALAEVIKKAIPASARRRGGHPARRTFQALRIAVNDELGALRKALADAVDRLAPGGRAVAISFHSLEDRIVKEEFVKRAKACTCPPGLPVCRCGGPTVKTLTKRPVTADPVEISSNPRARSAKLRAVVKLV